MVERLTVKALEGGDSGDWILDVLGVPYGSPTDLDADGEYFNADSNLYESDFGLPPVFYFHGLKGDKQSIGKTVSYEDRSDGRWYRVVLDKAQALAKKVWNAAQKGMAGASTGALPLLTDRHGPGGFVSDWPIAELSLLDITTEQAPRSKRAVAIPVLKAMYAKAGLTLPTIEGSADVTDEATDEGPTGQEPSEPIAGATETDNATLSEEPTMDEQEPKVIGATLDQIKAMFEERDAKALADAEAAKTRQHEIDNAVKAALDAKELEYAKGNRLSFSAENAPYKAEFGNTWKYDNLDDAELGLMIETLNSAKRNGTSKHGISEDAVKALGVRIVSSAAGENSDAKMDMIKAGVPVKANELNQSTLASYGDEWVGTGLSNQLWMKIVNDAVVAGRIPTIEVPQGVESVTIPIEGTSPTFYKVAQASAQASNLGRPTGTVTSLHIGTGQRVITPGKVGAAVVWSGEMEEDSMVQWMPELTGTIVREGAYTMDDMVINGDTATGATTNINDIGGTPAGTESFLVLDGFRKLALVTNTANTVSTAELTEGLYLEVLKLMGLGGVNALDQSQTIFIQDIWTGWKAMDMAVVKTRDVFSAATVERGMLSGIWGYEVINSPYMHRANTNTTYGLKAQVDGKVDLDTAGDNTFGAILGVNLSQWRLGIKRRMTIETTRYANSDANEIVALMRVGLNYRDTDAAAIAAGVIIA